MKKYLCALLSCSLLLGTLAGCGGDAGKTSSTSGNAPVSGGDRSEKMTISIALWDLETADDELAELVKKELNVDFELHPLSWDNPEQLSLFAATNSLPDVTGSYPMSELSTYYSWVKQGIIRDIPEDIINRYSYIKDIVADNTVLKAFMELQDNKIYYLPRPESYTNMYEGVYTGIYYRKDWLNKVGIDKAPDTIDGFYEMLKAFKEKDPDGNGKDDTIPFSVQAFPSTQPLDIIFGAWGTDPTSWYEVDGKWMPGYYTDGMLEPLKFFRKLYKEGLLDKEFTTISRNQMLQLFATDVSGCIVRNADVNWANQVRRNYVSVKTDANYGEEVGILPPLKVSADKKATVPAYLMSCGSYISSKVDDKKLDRIVDLMNYTLTPEGRDLFRLGIEGQTYTRDGDKINLILNPDTGEIAVKYASSALGSLATWDFDATYDESIPTDIPIEVVKMADANRLLCNEAATKTDLRPALISTETKDKLSIDAGDKFMQIIIGDDDVEKMFGDFKAYCKEQEIDKAIDEVTSEMSKIAK